MPQFEVEVSVEVTDTHTFHVTVDAATKDEAEQAAVAELRANSGDYQPKTYDSDYDFDNAYVNGVTQVGK